jgi:hypothetical protein
MRLGAVVAAGAVIFAVLVWSLGFAPGPDVFVGYGNQILSTTTTVWSTHRFAEHFGLAFYDVGDFEKKLAYVHSSPFHLALFVLYTKIAMALSHKPVLEAQRYMPFLTLAVFIPVFAFVAASMQPRSPRQLLLVFLFLGLFLTHYDLWAVKEGTPINPNPITISLCLGFLPFVSSGRSLFRRALWYVTVMSAFFPLYGLSCLLALYVVHHSDRPTPFYARDNLRDNLRLAALCLIPLLALAYGPVMAALSGFKLGGTPALHRMGLDGQRSLYQDYFQALFKPIGYHYSRPWSPQNPEWRFVPFVSLLLVSFALAGRRARECLSATQWRALFVMLAPYLMSLLVFPQSLAVHPCLYDIMLCFPIMTAAFLVAMSPAFEEQVRGFRFVLYLIFVIGFMLYQITDVAQVGFAKSGKPELLS